MRFLTSHAALLAVSLFALAMAVLLFGPRSARADTYVNNATVFPLPSNVLFPARSNRLSLKCVNPLTNANATITYASGFSFVMVPGSTLWETARPPQGAINATGTAGQLLACQELYQ